MLGRRRRVLGANPTPGRAGRGVAIKLYLIFLPYFKLTFTNSGDKLYLISLNFIRTEYSWHGDC
jgi:hypothetical protein